MALAKYVMIPSKITIFVRGKKKMNNSLNNDRDSKHDVCELKPYLADDIPEFERVVITRYRYGSHD